jgi:hypothetical protein
LPDSLPISIAGILMPVPVPSSPIITFLISSERSSITTTSEAPARSALRTLVTKEQFPRSNSTILVANASYLNSNLGSSGGYTISPSFSVSVDRELVSRVSLEQPSILFLSKYIYPI